MGNQGEHIVKRVIPLQHLYATLQGTPDTCDEHLAVTAADLPPDYDKKGFAIDALVASVAEGWKLAKTFANSA
jgi:ADP-ribose pyrophosphatase